MTMLTVMTISMTMDLLMAYSLLHWDAQYLNNGLLMLGWCLHESYDSDYGKDECGHDNNSVSLSAVNTKLMPVE